MKLAALALALASALGLAACGGKSTPAADPGGGGAGGGGGGEAPDCCCSFIEETMIGDGSEDTAENEAHVMMSPQACDDNSGSCVDAAQCAGGDEPVD
jgi:hypothetical protein